MASMVFDDLKAANFGVLLHNGDISLLERESVMRLFAAGRTKILVTTDILCRSIDIARVGVVVNFTLPLNQDKNKIDLKKYVQRIGRGGRFGRPAVAISLIEENLLYDATASLYNLGNDAQFI